MNYRAINRNKGFTLVELSIVLVIIGVLSAGILVAKSMIETARIINFGRQMTSYDVAISNFQTKYNGLPGDSSLIQPTTILTNPGFGCGTGSYPNGLDDGYYEGVFGKNDAFGCELAAAWPVLSEAQLLSNESYSYTWVPTPGNPIIAGQTVPKAKVGAGGQIMILSGYSMEENPPGWDNRHFLVAGYNFYWIGYLDPVISPDGTPSLDNPNTQGNFSSAEALAIDTKFDDGNATTGNVLASSNDARDNFAGGVNPECVQGATGHPELYNLNTNVTYPCSLVIKLLSMGGWLTVNNLGMYEF